MLPRAWCDPANAFGRINLRNGSPVQTRAWRPPAAREVDAPNEWASFRAAVIQNAYAVHLRAFKNAQSPEITRDILGETDSRPGASAKWTKRLIGTAGWHLDDTAVVLTHYPGALPDWTAVQVFLDVASGVRNPPSGWTFPDTAGLPQQI